MRGLLKAIYPLDKPEPHIYEVGDLKALYRLRYVIERIAPLVVVVSGVRELAHAQAVEYAYYRAPNITAHLKPHPFVSPGGYDPSLAGVRLRVPDDYYGEH